MFDWSGESSLAALFVAAFVSATVLPANSEIVLAAVLNAHPDRAFAAIALATLGNTLGGLTTYGLGRLVPGEGKGRVHPRAARTSRAKSPARAPWARP